MVVRLYMWEGVVQLYQVEVLVHPHNGRRCFRSTKWKEVVAPQKAVVLRRFSFIRGRWWFSSISRRREWGFNTTWGGGVRLHRGEIVVPLYKRGDGGSAL